MQLNKSNILFFFLDQLSAKWLEAARERLPLPYIRQLQQMGTTFSNTITSNPVCCPALDKQPISSDWLNYQSKGSLIV